MIDDEIINLFYLSAHVTIFQLLTRSSTIQFITVNVYTSVYPNITHRCQYSNPRQESRGKTKKVHYAFAHVLSLSITREKGKGERDGKRNTGNELKAIKLIDEIPNASLSPSTGT